MVDTRIAEARSKIYPENLLVNGGFEIWQRGNGPFNYAASPLFTTDEWMGNIYDSGLGTTGTLAVTQRNIRTGGDHSVGVDFTKNDTYNAGLEQGIENYGEFEDLWVTFSADVRCPNANAARLMIGDYSSDAEFVFSSFIPAGSEWNRYTVCKKIRTSLNGYAQWPHGYGLKVGLHLAATSGLARMDNAMFVVGYYPEGVPYRPLPRADDMTRCLRFYEERTVRTGWYWWSNYDRRFTANAAEAFTRFMVRKAAIPTVSLSFDLRTGVLEATYIDGFRITRTNSWDEYFGKDVIGTCDFGFTYTAEVG